LFRCERCDDFLEARVAPQRIPFRPELEKAVAQRVWEALHRGDLFDGEVFLANPGIDLRQINGEPYAVDGVLLDGQEFARATTLAECFFFPGPSAHCAV